MVDLRDASPGINARRAGGVRTDPQRLTPPQVVFGEEYQKLTRELAEIDAQDDTPDEVYDAVMRGIDEERRIQGRPPAFEGYY